MMVTSKIFVLLPLAAVVAAATSAHSQSPTSQTRIITVEDAFVTSIDEVRVPATETGMLMTLHIVEGQSVEKEGLLAEIDNRVTLAKQRVAKGEYDAAIAQAENKAELEVAEKAVDVSKAEYDSYTDIKNRIQQAVSNSELRKYKFQWEKAIAQQKQALNEHLIAEKTAMAKQAQYDATVVDLDLRQIKAPFRGQVVEILKKRGEWVQSGEAICHFVGLDRVRVSGFVTATEASPYELLDKPVEITVFAAGNKKHIVKGKIGFASPVIEGSGGTQFRVWAEVDNEKIVDSVTKQESWKVQPGTMAIMKIDLTPPAPKPIVSTKADPTKNGKTTPTTTTGTQQGAKTTVPESKTTPGSAPTGTKTTPDSKTAPASGKTTPPVSSGKTESLKPVTPGEDKSGSGKKEETKSTAGASKDSKER